MRLFRSLPPVVLLLLLLLSAPAARADEASPSPAEAIDASFLRAELLEMVRSARDEVFPALVSLRVVTEQYRGGKEIKGQAVGSGTLITAEGHVLTNEHVTSGGRRFVCILADQRRVPARLVGEDALTDLAVLQLELPDDELSALPVARFGDSSALEIGDPVMAMGSPLALSRSVSLGIVSNTERVFAGGFGSDDSDALEFGRGQRTGLFTRWIQHDALISPGNSGGPLVNLRGEVVGVNELGGGNLSFAIPSNLAERIARNLIEHGEVERSWFGVGFRPLGEDAEEGVRVSGVELGGPAHEAGVEAGDLLLSIDGEPITVRFAEEVPLLLDRLASRPVGSELELVLRRGVGDGTEEIVETTLVTRRLERDVGEEASFHAWGFTGQEITPKMVRDLRLDDDRGVLVTGVRRGGPAQKAEPEIRRGQVIVAAGGRPISDLDDLIGAYGELGSRRDEREGDDARREIVFEVEDRGRLRLTVLRPREEEFHDPPRELPKAWLGIATQPVLAELAGHLGLGEERGFRVTRVYPGTEASRSALRVGDVILSVDGEDLRPGGMEESSLLSRLVRSRPIGTVVELEVVRDGEELVVPVELERTRLTPDEARRHTDRDFELSVRELTFFDRDVNRWDDSVGGVIVENVDRGGWAGLGGVQPGDLVFEIAAAGVGTDPIRGLRSFRRAMDAIDRVQPQEVEVLVLRAGRTQHLLLEPDWSPDGEEE